ncbi:alginate O-acetyltransferase AlgX-related protein [Candidatus Uabimicrobium amorphum]|uniref:AlgX/AlgJ SGNH hydrolase-like domain-containing protein n=1 Tax=Uabimicrobium amorphum TaxID=2596890 RepID=A0A5S9IN41_UABAM|nr:hypothetical protein [Candidatus Uabimicrobium amorphum]BBM84580.1 hypothetical protein UABAM_02941 [Candidatus Uabimicrobium amorphum]
MIDCKKIGRNLAFVLYLVCLIYIAIPVDVVSLAQKGRPLLLGFFSFERLGVCIFLLVLAMVYTYVVFGKQPAGKKLLQVTVGVSSLLVSLFFLHVFLALSKKPHYIIDDGFVRHLPNKKFYDRFIDVPDAKGIFSLKYAQTEYHSISVSFTTDQYGFRNIQEQSSYDMIAVGDSFTENAYVSDKEVWTHVLQEKTHLRIFNMSRGGAHPANYYYMAKKYIPIIRPKYLLCTIFEGNDFRKRSLRRKKKGSSTFTLSLKKSPLKSFAKEMATHYLAITDENLKNQYPSISWLPLEVSYQQKKHYYCFRKKDISRLCLKKADFAQSPGWLFVHQYLQKLHALCKEHHVELIVMLAPSKPRIVVPLVIKSMNMENLYNFIFDEKDISFSYFKEHLLELLNTPENQLRAFCEKSSIPFINLSKELQRETARGKKLYFTYDTHWTPEGNRVVAGIVAQYMQEKD